MNIAVRASPYVQYNYGKNCCLDGLSNLTRLAISAKLQCHGISMFVPNDLHLNVPGTLA